MDIDMVDEGTAPPTARDMGVWWVLAAVLPAIARPVVLGAGRDLLPASGELRMTCKDSVFECFFH